MALLHGQGQLRLALHTIYCWERADHQDGTRKVYDSEKILGKLFEIVSWSRLFDSPWGGRANQLSKLAGPTRPALPPDRSERRILSGRWANRRLANLREPDQSASSDQSAIRKQHAVRDEEVSYTVPSKQRQACS